MKSKVNRVEILKLITAIALSLLIVFAIVFFISDQPMQAISSFLLGPLASLRRMGNIVELMIPLMFSGLAIIFIFRTGLFNLSSEGAIFTGAVVATVAALSLNLPPVSDYSFHCLSRPVRSSGSLYTRLFKSSL